jgi:hypothetical protein
MLAFKVFICVSIIAYMSYLMGVENERYKREMELIQLEIKQIKDGA